MTRRTLLSAALFLGLSLPQMAQAQRRGEPDPRELVGPVAAQRQEATRREVQAGRAVQMSEVVAMLNRRTPGRMLDADSGSIGGQPVYNVRWATSDGRRIDYVIDARNGAIISSRGG